jgi:hypothetical protein
MKIEKIDLFKTVMDIHNKGALSLTAEEKDIIEAETRSLLNSSFSSKKAEPIPKGFEDFLSKLKSAENPDEAFSMILSFLKDSGVLPNKEDGLGAVGPDVVDLKDDSAGSHGFGKSDIFSDKPEKGFDKKPEDKPEKGFDKKPEDKPEIGFDKKPEDKPEIGFGKKPEDKPEIGFGKKPEVKDKVDLKEKKELDIIPEKKKLDNKLDLLEKESNEEFEEDLSSLKDKLSENDSLDEGKLDINMGIKEPYLAAKVKVKITANKDILAYYDGKLVFLATPKNKDRESANNLRRFANKVYGHIIYDGFKSAALKFGAALVGGADSDVIVNFDEKIEEAKKPVTEWAEDVIKEPIEDLKSDVSDDMFISAEEQPDAPSESVLDDVDDEIALEKKKLIDSIGGAEGVVTEEKIDKQEEDVLSDSEVNFKEASIYYQRLYANRAEKMAKDAVDVFIKKFIRAFKLAAKRMELNYDEHPFKAAAVDILVDNSLRFSDGVEYAGMEERDAVELTERIAQIGHDAFVNLILERTHSLMKKSDEYLVDLESDLENVSTKPVEVDLQRKKSKRSEELKKVAKEGNFSIKSDFGVDISEFNSDNTDDSELAINNTFLAKRAKRLLNVNSRKGA